jgi:MSHA biogenesis protein MshN
VAPKPLVVKDLKPQTPTDQAEELWRQASRLVEQGRGRDAQARLEQALQLDPLHLRARQTLVVLALEEERRAAAEALLRQGITLHPNEAWFPRSLAQLHIQQGDYAQAASVLKASLGKDSTASDWGLYASTLAKMGRGDETAAAYREALRRDASQGPWWIGLGLALEQTGQAAMARDAFAHALQTNLAPELKEFASRKAQGS